MCVYQGPIPLSNRRAQLFFFLERPRAIFMAIVRGASAAIVGLGLVACALLISSSSMQV